MRATSFSQEDLSILRSILTSERQRVRNSTVRPRVVDPVERASEVCVVRTPASGIAPLIYVGTGTIFPGGVYPSVGTGSATGSTVGYLDSPGRTFCPVYRVINTNKNVPMLRPLGYDVPVINLASEVVPGNIFTTVKREKFADNWLIDRDSAAANQSTPAGLPGELCWTSKVCPTLKGVKPHVGTGSVKVVTKITEETTCLDTTTGQMTVTCKDDPGGCCPPFFCPYCCAIKLPNPDPTQPFPLCLVPSTFCLQLSNGTNRFKCLNGLHFCLVGGGANPNYSGQGYWTTSSPSIDFNLICPGLDCVKGYSLFADMQCPWSGAGGGPKNPLIRIFFLDSAGNGQGVVQSSGFTLNCGPPITASGTMTKGDAFGIPSSTIDFTLTQGICGGNCIPGGYADGIYLPIAGCDGIQYPPTVTAVATGAKWYPGTYTGVFGVTPGGCGYLFNLKGGSGLPQPAYMWMNQDTAHGGRCCKWWISWPSECLITDYSTEEDSDTCPPSMTVNFTLPSIPNQFGCPGGSPGGHITVTG